MSECTHDCSSCGADCASRGKPESLLEAQNAFSNVKKVIAVVSGKGGVGKSLVTSLLAVLTKRNGSSSAVLDADITGPSIPKMFGIHDKAMGTEDGILPVESRTGVKMMSVNLLLVHKPSCLSKYPFQLVEQIIFHQNRNAIPDFLFNQ